MTDTEPAIDPLLILLSRAARGVLNPEEGDKLRAIVGAMQARIVTLEAVCESNKRSYVGAVEGAQTLVAERDQHAATIARVRHLAERWRHTGDRKDGPLRELLNALGEQPDAAQPATFTHACPADGSGLTPCCRRTPFEIGRTHRLTRDPALVTCPGITTAGPTS